jgi:hypothetical protein
MIGMALLCIGLVILFAPMVACLFMLCTRELLQGIG